MDDDKTHFEHRPEYIKALNRTNYLRKKINGLNEIVDNITNELELAALKAKLQLCESQMTIAEVELVKAREKCGIIARK